MLILDWPVSKSGAHFFDLVMMQYFPAQVSDSSHGRSSGARRKQADEPEARQRADIPELSPDEY